ncbi:DUF4145 domain-containing protein [Flavobacterium psychrophilum]|uniref:DUF4145 domain-containing protein n=1 Tax=Flavobacterium psychrophilum TaxID=96345 RepID=UPI001C8FA675|nr:DUF4145 domain-containing protein [Flavobacterium psychrophilum]EKT4549510.1 DUF4145 domain-containing protein [Flavobacterium psychrophilum]QZL00466.1 DUF4145 domain-containing protein [Flavobacterium psychrophilum]
MSKDYCPICSLPTNHKILFSENRGSESDDDFHWNQKYQVIQCNGCDNLQFRSVYSDENMFSSYDEYERSYEENKYYPLSISGHKTIDNYYYIPDKIRVVYLETLEAIKSNCYLLSGVGLRAIIEAIALEQNITGRNLEQKINNLLRNKFITEKDAHRLHSIRFLGNDSVHEMEVPKESKIRIALSIAEHLLNNLYLIDIEANQHLDTIITNFEDFKNMFLRKFFKEAAGQEKSIKEIFGKDFRRIESSYITNFTQQVIHQINNGTIATITIGSVKNSSIENTAVQHFVKV